MPRLSIFLAALFALAALARCGQPPEPLPTPVPRTPVPLSPDAISPENARQVKALQCLDKGVAKALAFSPDGSLLVIAGGNRLIVYDAHSLAELRLIDPQVRQDSPPYITSLAFSHDGTTLAAGFEDGYVRLFEPRQGALLQKFGPHVGTVIAVAFSADGQTVASAGWDSELRIWRVADGALLDTFMGPAPLKRRSVRPECSMPAAFSPDGALIAWACDRNLGLYRVQDGVRLRDLSMPEKVQALAFSPDGTMLAASTDKRTRIWQMDATGGLSARDLRFGGPRSLAFSHDSTYAVRRTEPSRRFQGTLRKPDSASQQRASGCGECWNLREGGTA
jgi:hypothetical protein